MIPIPDLWHALPGLAAIVAMLAGLAAIGALVCGRRGDPAAFVTAGWGVACLASLLATLWPGSLDRVALGLGLLAVAGAAVALWRRQTLAPAGLGRMALLALPLVALAATMRPSQWDEFSHWLEAADYLLRTDGFPGPGRPPMGGDYPAYPYGFPLLHYLAGRIGGGLIETTGPVVNLALLLLAAVPVLAMARRTLGGDGGGRPAWGWCGLALLAATVLSPTFVPKIVFSNYADTAQAVALLFFALAGWRMVGALGTGGSRADAWAAAREAGACGAALVLAKPTGLVLAGVVGLGLAGLMVAAGHWRRPGRPGLLLGLAAAPAAIAHLAWGRYIATHLPDGRQTVHPIAAWDWTILPDALVSMGHVIANKGGFFGLVAVIAVFAWRGRRADPAGPAGLYALFTLAVLGHTAFLAVAYVAIFGDYEGRNAASFWRYNIAFGPLAAVLAADLALRLWRRLPALWLPRLGRGLALAGLGLPLVVGLAALPWLRFDRVAPKEDLRAVARDLRATLPAGTRLVVVDPLENGFYARMLRYELRGRASLAGQTNVFAADGLARAIEEGRPDVLWVHTATPATEAFLGLSLPAGASYLLVREAGGAWGMVRSWPFSGYRIPNEVAKG